MKVVDQEYDPAIAVDALVEHPENPRVGDDAAVADSVGELGFFGAILVQRSTNYVCAGNTRLRVARAEGAGTIPGFWIDVDDDTARRILLADNRMSDLAYYQDDVLMGLLADLAETSRGLAGTGYDQTAYELLLQQAASADIYGGVRQVMTPSERLDSYTDSDIRSIILPYQGDEFDRIVGILARLRDVFGYDTNAEVVARLLGDADAQATA